MTNAAAPPADPVILAAEIVAAFLAKNPIPASDLAALLGKVHAAVAGLTAGPIEAPAADAAAKATPAQIRKSITPAALISFIDGKPYKTLKRHLTTHGLTIAGYRARYGLPDDYPTVAASYSATRSALAKSLGLGRRHVRSTHAAAAPTPLSAEPTAKPKRGRPPTPRTGA